MCCCDFFLGVIAIVFPPLPVWVKRGMCSADSVINILLCMLGFLPGLLHSWYIIIRYPEPDFVYSALDQDTEATSGGRVTYVVVHPSSHRVHNAAPKIQSNMNYGATANGNGASAAAAPAAASIASAPAASSARAHTPAPAPAPAAAAAASSSSAAASSSRAPAPAGDNAGEGRSDAPPPSYAQAVAGDNKIQTQD